MATKKDLILLAGKGHEPYQEINGVKHPFDERVIVRNIIEKLDKYKSKFDVKKFMKHNPHLTISDFNMIMFNELSGILN